MLSNHKPSSPAPTQDLDWDDLLSSKGVLCGQNRKMKFYFYQQFIEAFES